ncbi:hypothetical protein [Draconibacterium mangrovi]|uniref:hypothetical protein n=1 Tax=Draconibacterium mangrovi TaxID=2697469 RepID=UPI0013D8452A|nr:hypothetical protein [Draconibacterium mangrovi]
MYKVEKITFTYEDYGQYESLLNAFYEEGWEVDETLSIRQYKMLKQEHHVIRFKQVQK